ncbi:hypothetical protein FQZ97_929310 [compost metagenome]
MFEQAAGGFLAAEPGTFHAAGQAPVATGVETQVGIGQRSPLVPLARPGIEPAVGEAEVGGRYGAADHFREGAVEVLDHRFLGHVQVLPAPGAAGMQDPGVQA